MEGVDALFAVTCVFTVVIGYSAVRAWLGDRVQTMRTLSAIRWWNVPLGLVLVAIQVVVVLLLWEIPAMRWGWWTLVAGTPGNAALGQSNADGLFTVTASVLPVLFAFAVPREARAEEVLFRLGSERRSRPLRVAVAFGFGAVHIVVGVPLAAALSLIVAGGLYDVLYLRAYRSFVLEKSLALTSGQSSARQNLHDATVERLAQMRGVEAAAAQHAVTNWLILSVLFAAILGWV